ncbi:ankyrin repeat-containing domain protein [Achaetomium macrosporum]|uniref:Ankyrin repeat-containing domain protein n=1 Tax=Achaetomium macrosporum TaxID=79813 RepID=A0AAN7C737_9PEZI|nr:ankyrin repeat-containing domain protein [Achaetomium macrosporum]
MEQKRRTAKDRRRNGGLGSVDKGGSRDGSVVRARDDQNSPSDDATRGTASSAPPVDSSSGVGKRKRGIDASRGRRPVAKRAKREKKHWYSTSEDAGPDSPDYVPDSPYTTNRDEDPRSGGEPPAQHRPQQLDEGARESLNGNLVLRPKKRMSSTSSTKANRPIPRPIHRPDSDNGQAKNSVDEGAQDLLEEDVVFLYKEAFISGELEWLGDAVKRLAHKHGMTEAQVILGASFQWPRWNYWGHSSRKRNLGSLLHQAVRQNNTDVITYLCSAEFFTPGGTLRDRFLNARDCNHDSALLLAIKHNPPRLEIAQQLIELGADVGAEDNGRWTPLHHATRLGLLPLLPLLVEAGASVYSRTREGDNLLHVASCTGNPQIVEAVLGLWDRSEVAFSVGQVNRRGQTPIDTARELRFPWLAEMLEKAMEETMDGR